MVAGLDLNQRPLGYEGRFGHHSHHHDEPTHSKNDEALLNGVVGASWFTSVAFLHSRFIGRDFALAAMSTARAAAWAPHE
jgi:hypothetical protein